MLTSACAVCDTGAAFVVNIVSEATITSRTTNANEITWVIFHSFGWNQILKNICEKIWINSILV